MINTVLIWLLGALMYGSGFLVWPACALLWRRTSRRTKARQWSFLAELAGQVVLGAFFVFSHGILEHQYNWLMLMIILNVLFTPVMLVCVIYDLGSQAPTA